MLELRPNCENCGKSLPNESEEAMICSFECTFCADCVINVLKNVCPNCGGGFEKRPVRPKLILEKYPVGVKQILNPVNFETFTETLEKYKNIKPGNR